MPIASSQHSLKITDQRYEVKTLKFKKDKFEVKIYDCQNKTSKTKHIEIPEESRRVPTKSFGYVSLGADFLLSGGQFLDDKTCSIDTFLIKVEEPEFQELKTYMKVARMQHSMVYVEEKE